MAKEFEHTVNSLPHEIRYINCKKHRKPQLTTSGAYREDHITSVTLYPNPMTEEMTLRGFLAKASAMTMDIRDSRGRRVYAERLQLPSGLFSIRRRFGTELPRGIYFLTLQSANQMITKKLVRHEP